jgi:hypothetical protein
MCRSIYTSFPLATMAVQALRRLPASSKAVHDLRRRMAAVFLFGDMSYARRNVDLAVSLGDISDMLRHDGKFKGRSITDFAELTAYLGLVDIVTDIGCRPSADLQSTDPALARRFNDDVDSLVHDLKKVASSIPDKGLSNVGPPTAKMEIDWMGERLSYSVRTKLRPKEDVYDQAKKKGPAADRNPLRQPSYMAFLKNRTTTSGEYGDGKSLFGGGGSGSKKRSREEALAPVVVDMAS